MSLLLQDLRAQTGQQAAALAADLEKGAASMEIVAGRLKALCWDSLSVSSDPDHRPCIGRAAGAHGPFRPPDTHTSTPPPPFPQTTHTTHVGVPADQGCSDLRHAGGRRGGQLPAGPLPRGRVRTEVSQQQLTPRSVLDAMAAQPAVRPGSHRVASGTSLCSSWGHSCLLWWQPLVVACRVCGSALPGPSDVCHVQPESALLGWLQVCGHPSRRGGCGACGYGAEGWRGAASRGRRGRWAQLQTEGAGQQGGQADEPPSPLLSSWQ
jgi:hypothetical protein